MEGIKIHRSLPQGPRRGPDIPRPLVLQKRHPGVLPGILPCGRHRATSLARLGMTSRLTFSPGVNPQPASVGRVRFPLFSTCGRGTTNISHLAVSNPGMSFPRSPVDLHSRGHVVYTCINVQIDRRSLLIMTWTWDFEFPPITWRQLAAGLLSPSLSLETLIMESNSTFPALPEPRRVES